MEVLLVEPGKEARIAEIGDGLKSLQAAVGGWIEAVYPFDDPVALVCNDEGKIMQTLPSPGGLTPDGNLALIDDILGGSYYSSEEIGEGGKMQFVTVESKNGNTFYLVIDHATGDVYFLNLVDEADLLALLEDEGYEVECDCAVKCAPGEVNTDCPVCRTDLSECTGEEPAPTPEPTAAPEPESEDSSSFNAAALLPIALIAVLGAGGAYYFLRVRKRRPDTSGSTDLDDYDFPDDEDEVK